MSDYYESENSCTRCLRNSPIASLLGFIIVLIGGGAFAGASIFARRYLLNILNAPHLLPCSDYVIYGLVGAIGLSSLVAYLICALSSGGNAKHCFESSRKSACGRCCNMTLIIGLVFGLLLWTAIACVITYPVMSIALLMHRNDGPARLQLSSLDVTGASVQRGSRSPLFNEYHQRISRRAAIQPPSSSITNEDFTNSNFEQYDPQQQPFLNSDGTGDFSNPQNSDLGTLPESSDSVGKAVQRQTEEIGNQVPGGIVTDAIQTGEEAFDKVKNVVESAKTFFQCDESTFDLSYYGLYDENGLPIRIKRDNFEQIIQDVFICVCTAIAGVFLLILGYLQIVICTAMNYARMQERRYYEASDAGEEGVALQQ